jgi:hypothetical protein
MTDLESLPLFDIDLPLGLLLHLDDADAVDVIKLTATALKPVGKLVTIDLCCDPPLRNLIARLLIRCDKGQNCARVIMKH